MEGSAGGEKVKVTRDGGVAVVTIDNPPVNALGHAVRRPLLAAIESLSCDAGVEGVVIACAGRTFVAGADITEFGKPPQPPSLRDVIALLDGMKTPTVAAIHGTALGGGLELALACHYRIAAVDSRLGLPEVKLGLLPGAGGTVRLPRLVGPLRALDMIACGEPVNAMVALEIGLVDAIAHGDLVAEAVSLLRNRRGESLVPTSARSPAHSFDEAAFEAKAASITARAKGLRAPLACVKAVRNAVDMPFAEALAAERALFEQLLASTESKAQRHLFFAEREAAKVPFIRDVKPRPVSAVGVVGAGTMGGGIAMAFANAGLPVMIVEVDEATLARGLDRIAKTYEGSVARGSLSQEEKTARLEQIRGTTDLADLGKADLIVEAAFEEMDVKLDVFARLDKVARPGAVLATNTSYLDVNRIAAATGRPDDVVGMHFFSPANVMKLVEIVRAEHSSAEAIATALDLARRMKKIPVVVGVCHGFVGNRMLQVRNNQNEALLLEGSSPEEIDSAFREFGWSMGPFQVSDLAGLDISWRMRRSRGETAAIADALCEAGRFGQKSGAGYYRYPEGGRTPQPDEAVTELIERKARELGISRRKISTSEIIERTHYPMVREGMRILEEGIAQRASDIDVVWIYGYGFPVSKGGPMFWAETIEGLAVVAEALRRWHERTGLDLFDPAPVLARLDRPRS